MKLRYRSLPLLGLLLLLAVVACDASGGGAGDGPGADSVPATGVTISPSVLSLSVGNGQYLLSTVTPSNATNKYVDFSSDFPSVATVNPQGYVLAIAPGNATITATTRDGGHKSTCAVTVTGNGGDGGDGGGDVLSASDLLEAFTAYDNGYSSMLTAPAVYDEANDSYSQTNGAVSLTYGLHLGPPLLYAGTCTFNNYVDTGTGYSITGILSYTLVSSDSTASYDFSGSLTFSGGSISSVAFDYGLVGSSLSGTMTIDGVVYDIATYAPVSEGAPLPVSFSVPTGRYDGVQSVSLSSEGAGIYYTVDGSMPSASSLAYTGMPLLISGTTVLRAVAIKDGVAGRVATAVYIFPHGEGGLSVEGPPLLTVSLLGVVSPLSQNTSMEVTAAVSKTPDSYAWYLDGSPIAGESGSSLTINPGSQTGPHTLMVVVSKNGYLFSDTKIFQVE